jgi:hypothetical protein
VFWSIPADKLAQAVDFIGYWYARNLAFGQRAYAVRVEAGDVLELEEAA